MSSDLPLFSPPRLTGKYLHKTLASGWLTSGPRCQELQEAVAAFLGRRPEQVVLAASATAGFQGVLDLISRMNKLDTYVSIEDATWPGMHQAIKGTHRCARWLEPTLYDCPAISVGTDIGGARGLRDKIPPAKWLVHDAAHSWLPAPAADFGLVSFYPTKLVPGAEGGAVVCREPEYAERLRRLLYCGLVPGDAARTPRGWGRKANMTDVAAALNLEALELAPKYIDQIDEAYCVMAREAQKLGVPFRWQNFRPYLFQVECDPAEWQPKLPYRTAWNFPPARLLTVPMWPGMGPADAQKILLPFAPVTR